MLWGKSDMIVCDDPSSEAVSADQSQGSGDSRLVSATVCLTALWASSWMFLSKSDMVVCDDRSSKDVRDCQDKNPD